MPLFRFHKKEVSPYYIELGYHGVSYRNNEIIVNLTEKRDNTFSKLERIGIFRHNPKTAKKGYKLESPTIGEVEIKFVTKFLIISEIQVFINGKRIKGSEILDYKDLGQAGMHT